MYEAWRHNHYMMNTAIQVIQIALYDSDSLHKKALVVTPDIECLYEGYTALVPCGFVLFSTNKIPSSW